MSIVSNYKNNVSDYNVLLLVCIFVVFTLVISLFSTIKLQNHFFTTHSSAISTAEQMISDITASRLWLKENASDNINANNAVILRRLDTIAGKLPLLQFAGSHPHLFIQHPEMASYQQLHQQAQLLLERISAMTRQRLANTPSSGAVDNQFNPLLEAFTGHLRQMHNILQRSFTQHTGNLSTIEGSLIAFAFFAFLLTARVVHLSFSRQRSHFNNGVESETHTESILRNALDAVVTIDEKSTVLSWNKKAETIFGWSADEAVGQSLVNLVIPERYRQQHLAGVKRLTKAGAADNLTETRARCSALQRNGKEIFIELSLSHHILDDKHYFTAFVRNISERIKTELALKEAEQRLTEAQAMAKIGSWELDIRENSLKWSDEIYRIFEIDKTSFGASYDDFLKTIHPDDRESVNSAYTNSLLTRKPYNIDHRLLMQDGRIKYVRESCESFFDPDGTPVRSIGTVQDISKHVASQREKDIMSAEMEHMQRLESLGVLAGGIAHDFNNILSVIMTNSELASLQLTKESPILGHLNHITKATEKASFLCKQMLAYSGNGQFSVEPIILSDIVEEMGQLLRTTIPDNITLQTRLDHHIAAIDADTSQIIQLIMNLILNASESISPNPGTITISTGAIDIQAHEITTSFLKSKLTVGKYIYLKVADSGCGMSPDTINHLFEPFFTTKFTGRGLGMSAVLGIVHGHGGDILVSSEQGKGSLFELYFPYSSLETTSPSDADTWNRPNPDENCILIIDHPLVGKVTTSILKNNNIQTLFAANTEDAKELFEQYHRQISAVLLDISRPEPQQENIFTALCHIDPDVKIFVTSNYNETLATKQIPFIAKNLAGFIQKPFAADELIAKVSKTFNKT